MSAASATSLEQAVQAAAKKLEAHLREVVSRPAELLSARFETGTLAQDIARRAADESVKDTGALPLLSYLLDDMWSRMVGRGDGILRLPAEAFELGGVLADRANAFLASHPKSEGQLRRLLTLKLATVREDGEPTRRRALRSEFSDEDWRLVSELADHPHRLLVTATPEAGATYAEVAHEAIFRRWDKLRDWITAERDFLIWKSGLETARRTWEEATETTRSDALLMGLALAQAQGWLAKRAEDLPGPDRDFIDQSLGRELQERRQREKLRRRVLASALIGLTAATILAVVALMQWREADLQRSAAIRQEQAAQDERGRTEQALATTTQITNSFVFELWQEFRDRGLPTDLMDKMVVRAIDSYSRAIKLNPNDYASYVGRGSAYREKNDNEHAIADFKPPTMPRVTMSAPSRTTTRRSSWSRDMPAASAIAATSIVPNETTTTPSRITTRRSGSTRMRTSTTTSVPLPSAPRRTTTTRSPT